MNIADSKTRRFGLEFKSRNYGIVDSHLFEISEEFPAAIFLLEQHDFQGSFGGKRVIRGAKLIQEVFDGDQHAQGLDWTLLDIFSPFRTEYFGEEHDFGTLWGKWLDAINAAAKALKDNTVAAEFRDLVDQGRDPSDTANNAVLSH